MLRRRRCSAGMSMVCLCCQQGVTSHKHWTRSDQSRQRKQYSTFCSDGSFALIIVVCFLLFDNGRPTCRFSVHVNGHCILTHWSFIFMRYCFYRAMLRRARLCRLSVCLSVCASVTFRYRDHIGWNIIYFENNFTANSLSPLLGLTPTWVI